MDEPVDSPGAAAWCDHCNRLVQGDGVGSDAEGRAVCARCHNRLGEAVTQESSPIQDDDEEGPPRAPWHFKVLLVGTVLYLIYRLVWFIMWLSHHA